MKKGKSKILRTVAITLAVIAALLLLAAGAVKINDLLRRNEDRSLMERFGLYHPVDGGGSDLNLISYGNADGHTIVCLSGLAVEDMCITYRDMTDELARDNRIVFIDRAGYGMSDDSMTPMTVGNIVDSYRTALANEGIKGPVILVAHSLGGVYATYWQSHFPSEVEGLVLLDSTQLRDGIFEGDTLRNGHNMQEILLNKLGLYRIGEDRPEKSIEEGAGLEEERTRKILSYRMTLTGLWNFAMNSEYDLIRDNCAQTWNSIETNDIPKLYICATWASETEQKYIDARNNILMPYLQKMGNARLALLAGEHLIYEQRPADCARLIKELIDTI